MDRVSCLERGGGQMSRRIQISYRFLIDVLALFVLVYYLSVVSGLMPPVWSFIAGFFLTMGFFYLFNRLVGHGLSLIHFYVLIPFAILSFFLFGLMLFHAVISGLFIVWRLGTYYFRPDTNQERMV